jgi:hypothetical protein
MKSGNCPSSLSQPTTNAMPHKVAAGWNSRALPFVIFLLMAARRTQEIIRCLPIWDHNMSRKGSMTADGNFGVKVK